MTTGKAFTTKEISELLEIGDSTLRKWCIALEKNDYKFMRTDKQRRLFTDRDIIVLRHFKELVQTGNMPLENAAMVIASRFSDESFSTGTPSVLGENDENNRSLMRSDEMIEKLLGHIKTQEEFIENQKEFNEKLIERLDQQQRYIEERINERDNKLTETLRLMAAAKEEENKKGLFSRVFKRK